ncbi:formate dehydrogenase accessory sulfurtransferase FdhD [Dehalobacter sp. DCM]|uniref:formate dehydrogenase accessory sulfurtransferase FdhD n=1 Tax=Dehalobacter sp. DCM TaxID=2907827 RepID=UPI00308209A0|nr:formate dehydrogenase accessory sulfurtransferase FdhD [Dehalobacter sp. DCM]
MIGEGIVYEDFDVIEIKRENMGITRNEKEIKVIAEVSLKIIVNGMELVSLLCLNQYQKELALGFLYNEGVINAIDDIKSIDYVENMLAVVIELKEYVVIDMRESLRSMTSGCGKCYTYINPLKQRLYNISENDLTFSANEILNTMNRFIKESELYNEVGGVHSVLFATDGFQLKTEDIGRHNCFDKIAGMLLIQNKTKIAIRSIIYISGRLTSEMLMKMIRLDAPIVVSKSTPTTATIRLARQYNITLLGYVKGDYGIVYSGSHRITD